MVLWVVYLRSCHRSSGILIGDGLGAMVGAMVNAIVSVNVSALLYEIANAMVGVNLLAQRLVY